MAVSAVKDADQLLFTDGLWETESKYIKLLIYLACELAV